MEVQEIAGETPLEHIAGIGHGLLRLLERRHVGFGEPPAGAVLDVELHLHIKDGHERGRRPAHVDEILALVDGKAVGPREVDKEQVVLAEIAAEAGLRQAAVGQPADEGVADIALPIIKARRLEPREQAVGPGDGPGGGWRLVLRHHVPLGRAIARASIAARLDPPLRCLTGKPYSAGRLLLK